MQKTILFHSTTEENALGILSVGFRAEKPYRFKKYLGGWFTDVSDYSDRAVLSEMRYLLPVTIEMELEASQAELDSWQANVGIGPNGPPSWREYYIPIEVINERGKLRRHQTVLIGDEIVPPRHDEMVPPSHDEKVPSGAEP